METTNKTPIEVLLQVSEDGTVSAKSVYEFLQLDQTHYAKWCRANIVNNQYAEEGSDYEVFALKGENPQGGRPTVDYKLSVSFAKKLCMRQGNERGEQARNYFIKVEEKLKEVALQAPCDVKYLNGVANYLRVQRNIMKDQGSTPREIASMSKTVCDTYQIPLPAGFVKYSASDQLMLDNYREPAAMHT